MKGYPGRIIICGLDHEGEPIALYILTARSPSSRERILTVKADGLWVEPTQNAQGGDPSLLYYRASFRRDGAIIIANGTHGERFTKTLAIEEALNDERYEPDEPIYTPRIAAVLDTGTARYAFASIRRSDDGSCTRSFFSFDALKAGQGHRIQTYEGDPKNPRAFAGPPIPIALPKEDIAQTIFDELKPDLRIAVAVIRTDGYELINTHGG